MTDNDALDPTNEYGAYLDERLAACRERPSLAAFEALAVDAISFALDHPYDTEADSYMCLHCGDTGSYAHTAEAQREWRASRRALLPTQASDSPEKTMDQDVESCVRWAMTHYDPLDGDLSAKDVVGLSAFIARHLSERIEAEASDSPEKP